MNAGEIMQEKTDRIVLGLKLNRFQFCVAALFISCIFMRIFMLRWISGESRVVRISMCFACLDYNLTFVTNMI